MNYLKSSIVVLALGLMACGGGNTENTALDTLGAQLKQLEDTMNTTEGMEWTTSNWEEINGTYEGNFKLAEEAATANGTDLTEYTTRWEAISAKAKEAAATPEVALDANGNPIPAEGTVAPITENVTAAYGALGIDATDSEFATITKDNILAAYQGFVKTVKDNYNKYDAADAKVISDLWDKLNARKEAVEPINAKDNLKIAALKTEFAAVKTGLKIRTGAEETADELEEKSSK